MIAQFLIHWTVEIGDILSSTILAGGTVAGVYLAWKLNRIHKIVNSERDALLAKLDELEEEVLELRKEPEPPPTG